MLLKHLDNDLALQNLLERCGRSDEFGNIVSEKDFVFLATVITSQSEIAGYAPEFWLDCFVFLYALDNVSTIT